MPAAPTLYWHVCFGISSLDCVQKTARGACKERADDIWASRNLLL